MESISALQQIQRNQLAIYGSPTYLRLQQLPFADWLEAWIKALGLPGEACLRTVMLLPLHFASSTSSYCNARLNTTSQCGSSRTARPLIGVYPDPRLQSIQFVQAQALHSGRHWLWLSEQVYCLPASSDSVLLLIRFV